MRKWGQVIFNLGRGIFKNTPSPNLAKKFSLLNIVLISLIMLSFIILLNFFFEKSVLGIVGNEYVQKFRIVSDNCTEILSDAERITKILFTNEDVEAWFLDSKDSDYGQRLKQRIRVESHLDYLEALYPKQQFSSISIYAADGEMVNSNGIRSRAGLYQQLFEDIQGEKAKPGWIDLYEKREDGYQDGGIAYLRPYRDYPSGQIKGYIIIEYKSELLSKNFTPLRYEEDGQYMVVDMEGDVKLFSDRSDRKMDTKTEEKKDERAGQNVGKEEFFQWATEGDRDGNTFNIGGEKYFITAARIDTLNWIMIGITPVSTLMEPGKAMTSLVYVLGIFAVVISSVLTFCLAHSVTRPLSELAHTMKSLGQGHLNVSVPVHAEDEIGMLSMEFNKMTGQIKNLVDQVYKEQRDKRKYELAVLQAQINPHFLYNTLSSVSALIKMQKSEDAFQMIRSIGQFYRTALSNGKNLIPLSEEIKNIESYLQIQSMRYGDKITYQIEFPGEILETVIVKLTLQPIVENAIYHGVKNVPHKGSIRICGYRQGEMVLIEVEDNGIGIDTNKAQEALSSDRGKEEQPFGFGLYNIQQRLKLYFGEEYGISISGSPGNGTVVTVRIPLEYTPMAVPPGTGSKGEERYEKGTDRR